MCLFHVVVATLIHTLALPKGHSPKSTPERAVPKGQSLKATNPSLKVDLVESRSANTLGNLSLKVDLVESRSR